MTNSKNTRKALITSMLALLLCFTMLLGTTFAWFTDSVSSTSNIIKSGTLKVTFEYKKIGDDDWSDASTGAIFNYDKWEPGYTEVRYVKIGNAGTLALEYMLNIAATGEVSELADVIDVYFIDGEQTVTRESLANVTPMGTLTNVLNGIKNDPTSAEGNLSAGDSEIFTVVLKMQESAGNEYQNISIGSEFAIQLLATQYTEESDSFDNQYDKDAEYAVNVSTADELAAALAAGGNIVLTADIEADSTFYVNAGATVNLDLNGKTITVNSGHAFSLIDCDVTVKNGTIDAKNYYAFNVGSSKNSIPANLTIESGTFKGIYTAVNLCYGTVTINGGYFEATEYSNGEYYTLNCIDRIYTAGNANMIVKGGTFYKFNPANNVSEGAGTNFCADGYTATENSDGTWTVTANN